MDMIQECVLALPSEGDKQVDKGHEKPKKDCDEGLPNEDGPIKDGGFSTQDTGGGGGSTNPPPPKPDPK